MPAVEQNFTMWAGNTKTLRITVRDDDGATRDLTGAHAQWWTGREATSTGADVFVKKDDESHGGLAIPVPASGIIEVTLDEDDTKDIFPGDWYHEAKVEYPDGSVVTVTVGTLTLEGSLPYRGA